MHRTRTIWRLAGCAALVFALMVPVEAMAQGLGAGNRDKKNNGSGGDKCPCPTGTVLLSKYDVNGDGLSAVFQYTEGQGDYFDLDEIYGPGDLLGFSWVQTGGDPVAVMAVKSGQLCEFVSPYDEEGNPGYTRLTVPAQSHVNFCSNGDCDDDSAGPQFIGFRKATINPDGYVTWEVGIEDDGGVISAYFSNLSNIAVTISPTSAAKYECQFDDKGGNPEYSCILKGGETPETLLVVTFTQVDKNIDDFVYWFRTTDACGNEIFYDPIMSWSDVMAGAQQTEVPVAVTLHENYPNPFNPSTTIRYDVAEATNVSLKVYDMLGREVRTLVSQAVEPGTYQVAWDGTGEGGQLMASGMYLYRLEAGSQVATRTMMLLK